MALTQQTTKYKLPNPNLVAATYPAGVTSFHSLLSIANTSGKALPLILGKTIHGDAYVADLTTMPHLLMAGATGQGKSVGINTQLLSLLYHCHPQAVKLVLIDPKWVELSMYKKVAPTFFATFKDIPQPVITETHQAIYALNSLCIEMDNRYQLLEAGGCRDIRSYNQKYHTSAIQPQQGVNYLPRIVVVIDEFGDLILTGRGEIEKPMARLAAKGRAAGIHLIIATQRPVREVVTGLIKANIPARIAYRVINKMDSRIILDAPGAELLKGNGDMLYSHQCNVVHLQGGYVEVAEIEKVLTFIHDQHYHIPPYELPEYEEI